MIKVCVADDHAIVREGLKQLLSEPADLSVVAEAVDGDTVMQAVRSGGFDVLLLDMSMPGRSGIELIKWIKAQASSPYVLVLSMYDEDQYAVRVIRAGARGYVTKTSATELLVEAVRRVAAGRMYISGEVAESLALELHGGDSERPPHSRLSEREYQVFILLAEGVTVSEIAARLHVSVKTVSTHKTRIMQKMGLRNISALIRYALDHGLVERSCLL